MLPKGQFHPKNVAKNLAKDATEQCQHFWINKRITIKRDGYGSANKVFDQKCIFCGTRKTETKSYIDERIKYHG